MEMSCVRDERVGRVWMDRRFRFSIWGCSGAFSVSDFSFSWGFGMEGRSMLHK